MARNSITVEDRVKGDIAESLVSQMFSQAGIPFMRFGFEHQVLDFTKRSRTDNFEKNEVSERLRLAPDFLIRNCVGALEFVEVKYWQQGRPPEEKLGELRKLAKYWAAKLVVVSYNTTRQYARPYFQVVKPPYQMLDDRNFADSYSIEHELAWGIDEVLVKKFRSLVVQLYKPFTTWDKPDHEGASK